jgi:tetratricopeptide (TPR) repeat protein/predicted Ser/Thr protein kinase
MMQHPTKAPCPNDDALAAFVEGRLDAEKARALEAHVDACASCYHVLATYARSYCRVEENAESRERSGGADAALRSHSFGKHVERLQRARGLPPGTLVGRYVVLDWVGEGGAGVVYAAYDPELDRKIALKLMQPGQARDQERYQATLLREARAMAKLAHPHVVNVHDVGTFEGQVFVAMEFVEGGTLRKWLRDEKRSVRQIVRVFLEAGRGLAAAHAAGLVHRDFKPENVLLGKDGRPRVTDFGLASSLDETVSEPDTNASSGSRSEPRTEPRFARTSAIGGTLAYMAPEHRLGRAADARSDQYSFSVSLYEALYGEHPFDPSGDAATLPSLAPSAREPRRADVPPRIRKILFRGLSAVPEQRYPSLEALLTELGADPSGRWKWVLLAGALLISVASIAFGMQEKRAQSARLCHGAERRLAGVWDEARKKSVSDAFLATGKPYAADAWRGSERALDTYAKDWIAMRTDACEATQVRGEQSPALLDLRMACLDDRMKEMNALTEVFAHADPVVVTNAFAAAESLTRVAGCADTKALMSRVKVPADANASGIEKVGQQLAQIKAMDDAGKYKDALPLAAKALDEARLVNYRPLEGEALLRYGEVQLRAGEGAAGQATLLQAAWAADASGDDHTRALIWCDLVSYGIEHSKDQLPTFLAQARAAVDRLGGDDEARALFLYILGHELIGEEKYDEARNAEEKALVLLEEVYGPDAIQVIRSLLVLALSYDSQGQEDEALSRYQAALAMVERSLGSTHPLVATTEYNMARQLASKLDFEGARSHYERAVEVGGVALGPEHPRVGNYLNGLGHMLALAGRYEDAVAVHQRAIVLQEKLGPDDPWLAGTRTNLGEDFIGLRDYAHAIEVLEPAQAVHARGYPTESARAQFALAQALVGAGRDLRRAHQLAVQARDVYAKSAKGALEKRHLGEVEAWLLEHPQGP